MIVYLTRFMKFMRPGFSRKAAHRWFVVAFAGFVLRGDNFGVSSIVRALTLPPECYTALLHFFHSSAWSVQAVMELWWKWLFAEKAAYRVGERIVIVGDHTKTPKDGRRIPAVTTLKQDSETSSKPSFFRGHHWGCIGLLVDSGKKFFAIPLEASIQEGADTLADPDIALLPKTVRIVQMARRVVSRTDCLAYLVLDAYFSAGPVFTAAAAPLGEVANPIHIITRAKKNAVAYRPARPKPKGSVGRKHKYGEKLKLMQLFDSSSDKFRTARANVYGNIEQVRCLALDLLWKPTRGTIRFILLETSRGRIILMSSDLHIESVVAIHLYCRRITIETFFDTLKNIMGGLRYRFWSSYLSPASRRPARNKGKTQLSSQPEKTRNTFAAIEKFVNLQLLVIGLLQLLAILFPAEIKSESRCWLRTVTSDTPSEFVTRAALSNIIKINLFTYGNCWISQLIRRKQNPHSSGGEKFMINL